MSELNASIQWIAELEFQSYSIPDYQRPYVWSIKETRQLWDDILQSKAFAKQDYRIGTIILYNNKENNEFEIIDGQQRLTTLSILLHLLADERSDDLNCSSFLSKKQFLHQLSAQNIKANADELRQWIEEEFPQKNELLHYILEKCSVTVLIVDDISAAFQIFDSQNGRGLTLQAYNLLKAFHMRFFNDLIADDKIQYDKIWEQSAQNSNRIDYLQQVIHEQLYRSRIWSRNQVAYSFSRKKIKEFKGSSSQQIRYPYENYIFCNYLDRDKYIHRYINETLGSTFQINQPIINGVSFFDYTQTYVNMYQLLFENREQDPEFYFFTLFYNTYCTKLRKKGDGYLLELYKSLIMLTFDRFGILGIRKYYKILYAYVFRFRLEKRFVKYDSVAKFPSSVFNQIYYAKDILDLNFIRSIAFAPIKRQENNKNNEIVEAFFRSNFNISIS